MVRGGGLCLISLHVGLVALGGWCWRAQVGIGLSVLFAIQLVHSLAFATLAGGLVGVLCGNSIYYIVSSTWGLTHVVVVLDSVMIGVVFGIVVGWYVARARVLCAVCCVLCAVRCVLCAFV